jgi:hypothetical protein
VVLGEKLMWNVLYNKLAYSSRELSGDVITSLRSFLVTRIVYLALVRRSALFRVSTGSSTKSSQWAYHNFTELTDARIKPLLL